MVTEVQEVTMVKKVQMAKEVQMVDLVVLEEMGYQVYQHPQ